MKSGRSLAARATLAGFLYTGVTVLRTDHAPAGQALEL